MGAGPHSGGVRRLPARARRRRERPALVGLLLGGPALPGPPERLPDRESGVDASVRGRDRRPVVACAGSPNVAARLSFLNVFSDHLARLSSPNVFSDHLATDQRVHRAGRGSRQSRRRPPRRSPASRAARVPPAPRPSRLFSSPATRRLASLAGPAGGPARGSRARRGSSRPGRPSRAARAGRTAFGGARGLSDTRAPASETCPRVDSASTRRSAGCRRPRSAAARRPGAEAGSSASASLGPGAPS